MYNRALVTERIAVIQNSVKRLRALRKQVPLEAFVASEDAIDIAENRLRRALSFRRNSTGS